MKLKTTIIAVAVAVFTIAIGTLLAGPGGSHPDSHDNGRNSPRFYASPHEHPQHPRHP